MENPPYPRLAIANSPIAGKGSFAAEAISPGAVILRVDDSRIVGDDHPLKPEAGESVIHCNYLPDGTVTPMRSAERHINHSCESNSYIYSTNRERFLLAMRDIAAGEEILMDYAFNAVDGDEWECRCGADHCRGFHKCDFFTLPPKLQLEYLPYLAARVQRLLEQVPAEGDRVVPHPPSGRSAVGKPRTGNESPVA